MAGGHANPSIGPLKSDTSKVLFRAAPSAAEWELGTVVPVCEPLALIFCCLAAGALPSEGIAKVRLKFFGGLKPRRKGGDQIGQKNLLAARQEQGGVIPRPRAKAGRMGGARRGQKILGRRRREGRRVRGGRSREAVVGGVAAGTPKILI